MESTTSKRGATKRGGCSAAVVMVLVVLCGLLGLAACGSEEGLYASDCPSGEIKARVDGETACYVHCAEGSCATGFTCVDAVCLPATPAPDRGGDNNDGNGGDNGGGSPNNDTNNVGGGGSTNNGGATNNADVPCTFATQEQDCAAGQFCHNERCRTPAPAELDECERYCDLIWGSCIKDNCTGIDGALLASIERECIYGAVALDDAGDETGRTAGCLRDILSPAVRQQNANFIAEESCDSLSYFRCGQLGLVDACACEPPELGGPCTGDDECDGGDLIGACIPALDENDQPTGFLGGYCIAGPCQARDDLEPGDAHAAEACGPAGACLITPQGRGICVDRCTSHTECREGYACSALTLSTRTDDMQSVPDLIASCDPGCSSSDDCADGFACLDGACAFSCSAPALADLCGALYGTCVSGVEGDFCELL